MKKQVQVMIIATMAIFVAFSFNGYGQELFSTIFNEEANWDNPGGVWTGYNEKTYEESGWFFHSTQAVRGSAAESYGGSAYSFRDRDVFSVHNTAPVSGMSGFSMQLRDWMLPAPGVDRNLNLSVDGGDNWETIAVINKDWFDAYQVYQEYSYFFPGGPQSFAAEELMIELDGGTNDNIGRINIGQFVALGEPSQVATPAFDPPGGLFFDAIEVNITTQTPEASIYYTIDGTEPTQDDHLFTDPVLVDGNLTINARAFKIGLEPSNVATAEYVIRTLVIQKDFEDDDLYSGGWTVHDYIDGANSWEVKSFGGVKFAEIREFQSDPPFPHSWYVSPALNLDNYQDAIFSFESLTAFRTGDALSVYISTDYTGEGDPANATWTALPAQLDPHTGSGYGSWTQSGDIDLSAYSGTAYIGFEYESDEDNNGTWQITNILVHAAGEAELSNNAELETFTVGGINVLNLNGLVVDDPDAEPGATLYVEDFTDFFGIVVETQHEHAEAVVTVNGIAVAEEDLDEQEIVFEDVIVVTVTAEDQATVKHYKVTAIGENRIITILTPEEGDEFFTYDEILFSWETENIDEVLFELFELEVEDPIMSEVFAATVGETTMQVPNAMQGSYIFRLSDNSDLGFSAESAIFTITDNVEPVLLEKHPMPGAANLPVNTALSMIFDEDVMAGTGSIHLYMQEGDVLVESVAADAEQVTIAGDEVHVSFSDYLDFETTYYILIDDTAVQDAWGNHFGGIDDPSHWTFTTREDALICNGDFEFWFEGLPECWYGEKSNIGEANVLQYEDNPYTGSYAAQLINTSSSHRRFTSQAASVEEGVEYLITFWVKGQGEIRTGLFDDRETGFGYAPYNDYIIVESDTWAEYEQIITAANDSDIAEFIFSLRNTNEAHGHLQLDHVRIEEYVEPILHTVTFIVMDDEGHAIDDAVVTLGDIVNEAGDYVFTDIVTGEYAWSVSRLCYEEASGAVELAVEEEVSVELTLHLDIFPGDADGSGVIEVLDVIVIAHYFAGIEPVDFCFFNADVNNDGIINILDLIATVNLFTGSKTAPFPGLQSKTAHLFLGKDGIMLESDGTLAGLQFELGGEISNLGIELLLPGHELLYTHAGGLLTAIVFSLENSAIPAGKIPLVSFDRAASLSWSDALAGNLNSEKVPIITHHEEITSASTPDAAALKVYPNPATDIVWVQFANPPKEVSLYVMDVKGRIVKTKTLNNLSAEGLNISVEGLNPGIYMLGIDVVEDVFMKRIIVK